MQITDTHQLNTLLKAGPYAWPGGYPLYFTAGDGEALSFEAVEENLAEVLSSFEEGGDRSWRPVAIDINWEDDSLYCAHTGKQIECAYPNEEETT